MKTTDEACGTLCASILERTIDFSLRDRLVTADHSINESNAGGYQSCAGPSLHGTNTTQMWVFVPTPGDHYSPATGSANISRIYELARQHIRNGGEVTVIVGDDTRHDYGIGQCIEVTYPAPLTSLQKTTDCVLGAIGFRRPLCNRWYRPALTALDSRFNGVIFLYNNLSAAHSFRRAYPFARISLYLGNRLSTAYGRIEARHLLLATLLPIICGSGSGALAPRSALCTTA